MVSVQQFTGLPVGQTITQIGTNIASNGTQTQNSANVIGTTSLLQIGTIVAVEQFTGLPNGATIKSIGFNIAVATGNVRVKLYNDNAGAPGSLLAESGSLPVLGPGLQNFTISATIPVSGIVWAGLESDTGTLYLDAQSAQAFGSVFVAHTYGPGPNPFGATTALSGFSEILTYHDTSDHIANHILLQGTSINLGPNVMVEQFTGLPGGLSMSSICLNTGTSSDSANMRVKLYNDNAGAPGSLLAESGSTPVKGSGFVCVPISATIPVSGIMWAGYEVDNIFHLQYQASALAGSVSVAHTYGPGPNPFGTGATVSGTTIILIYHDNLTPHMRVKLYNDNAGAPGSLLAESGSQLIQGKGLLNFTISGVIPANGIVWAGFEHDSISSMKIVTQITQAFGSVSVAHTYGPGPNPFGATTALSGFYEQITYTSKPLNLFFDGSLLSPPSPITKSTTGSFSGVTFTVPSSITGIHTVNASETGGTFATSSFTIDAAPPSTINTLNVTGYILANNGIFNNPTIILNSQSNANVTSLSLFNTNGNLISFKDISSNPIRLTSGIKTTIPISLQDNSKPTGVQNYLEEAVLKNATSSFIVASNSVKLDYGSIVTGNLNFNFTNTNVVPIYFVRNDLNTTDTRLSVIYPNTMSILCNLNYTFAMTNKTYGPPLANVPFDSSNSNSSFKFHNLQNEIVNVLCTDSITKTNAKYVLTQNSFPFQQQIQNLRNGTYGTHGQIGILDFVTIGIIIISMIGFNRVNETVGVIFSISIIGASAFFGFINLGTFIAGAITIAILLGILSTRKTGGF